MNRNDAMVNSFLNLTTPMVADACVRSDVPLRVAPAGIRAVIPGSKVAGRALTARHYGSVDSFLAALSRSEDGDVFVIDNGGRTDEACIGDLVVLETQSARLSGIVLWGLHRDTTELTEIGLPVFSYGDYPAGPNRLDPWEADALESSRFGSLLITNDDYVFGDDNGVVFVDAEHVDDVLVTADTIRAMEQDQSRKMREGETLRAQTDFSGYLAHREGDPTYTFRQHLRKVRGAIEE
jgi:4-hydroxy-4-methyl-2-oxoglutarate aldolase